MSKTVGWSFSTKQKDFLTKVVDILERSPHDTIYLTVNGAYQPYSIMDVKNWLTHMVEDRNAYDEPNREMLNTIRDWYIREIKK